jgi:hypothetical protein
MALRSVDGYAELLDAVPWFESVGRVADESVAPVKDWKEAQVYICDQRVWLNFRNAISNRHRRLWDAAYPNDENARALDRVEKLVKDVVRRRKLKQIDKHLRGRQSRPSASFVYHVLWDLNFAGFEYVCQDDVPPLFFLPLLLPWYARGHFPCGWRGTMVKADWPGSSPADLPKGRLRVL